MKFSFVLCCSLLVLAPIFGRPAIAWGTPEAGEIEVRFQNPTEIFSPREAIILEIRPQSTLIDKLSTESHGEKSVNLHVALSRHVEPVETTTSSAWRRQETTLRGPVTELELQIPIHAEDSWIPVSLLAPMEEGIYEITISLHRKADRSGNSLLNIPVGIPANPLQKKPPKILIETSVRCVVFDSTPSARPSGDPVLIRKELLDTVDTTQPGWRKRLMQIPALPKVANLTSPLTAPLTTPLSSARLPEIPRLGTFRERPSKNPAAETATDSAAGEKRKSAKSEPLAGVLAELLEQWKSNPSDSIGSGHLTEEIPMAPPNGSPIDPSETPTFCSLAAPEPNGTATWEALPLSVQEIGRPHILELDYPSDRPQELGIRIVEMPENPGVSEQGGAVVIAGSNLRVVQEIVSRSSADGPPGTLATHRILFWPKTKNPMLLLVNRQPRYDAVFRNARLYRISTDGATETATEARSRFPKPISGTPQRRVFGYLHHAGILELLSTGSRLDGKPYRPTRWDEMFEGAERLTDTLLRGGYDGVLMTVASKNSTLYPTDRFCTESPDSGETAEKDLLELLYRLFDREQMTLVSAIDFDRKLRKIEDRLLEHPSLAEEIYWDPFSDGARYNLLHPLVQDAMLEVVAETVGRYARHPSFGGLAVQLSPDGYARLPITVQAVDDRTFSEFLLESAAARNLAFPPELAVPDRESPRPEERPQQKSQRQAARARFLQGDVKAWEAWLAWRSLRLRDFYAKLTKIVTDARPEAKLYLAGGTMLDAPELRNYCTPTLTHSVSLSYVLQILGFDLSLLNGIPSLVFLRPSRIESADVCYEQFDSTELGAFFLRDGAVPGTLFFHGPDETSATVPAGNRNRRRFVKHLAQTDVLEFFDGGSSLSFGGGEHLYDFIAAYRQLPPGPFRTFVPEKTAGPSPNGLDRSIQPVTVRFSNRENGLVVYLLNDAPFGVEAVLAFSPTRGTLAELSGRRAMPPLHHHETVSVWQVKLEPYDFQAVVLSDPQAVIRDVHVRRPVQYCGPDGELQQKIDQLNDRIRDVRQGIEWDKLENPDFEIVSENTEEPAGWMKSDNRSLSVRIDPTTRSSGRNSVKLETSPGIGGEPGVLWSDCFESPSTGRIFVSFSIGTAGSTNPPTLNVVLAGRHLGRDWGRSFSVQPAPSTDDGVGWHRALVAFDRLPTDSLEDLRLGFQLAGAGTVWLDDVSLYHVSFTPGEIKELQRLVLVARARCSQERVSELMTILEGHWSRFLFRHVSPRTETVARTVETIPPGPRPVTDTGSKPYAADKATPPKEETPKKENRGVFDRLRGLFGR